MSSHENYQHYPRPSNTVPSFHNLAPPWSSLCEVHVIDNREEATYVFFLHSILHLQNSTLCKKTLLSRLDTHTDNPKSLDISHRSPPKGPTASLLSVTSLQFPLYRNWKNTIKRLIALRSFQELTRDTRKSQPSSAQPSPLWSYSLNPGLSILHMFPTSG